MGSIPRGVIMTEEEAQKRRVQRVATMRLAREAATAECMSYVEFLQAVELGLGEPLAIAAAQALHERGELEHLMHWVWFPIRRRRW